MATYTMEMNGVIDDPSATDTTGLFGGSPTMPAYLQGDPITLTITLSTLGKLPDPVTQLNDTNAVPQNIAVNIGGAGSWSWNFLSPASDSMSITPSGPPYVAQASALGEIAVTIPSSGTAATMQGSVSEELYGSAAFYTLPANLNNPFPPPLLSGAATVGGYIGIDMPGPTGGVLIVGNAFMQGATLISTAPPPVNSPLKKSMGVLAPVMNILAPGLSYAAQLTAKSAATANTLGAFGLLAAVAGVVFQAIKDADPPDANWQSIATPVTPTVDVTGLSAGVAAGLTALAQLVGVGSAMVTTYNRLSTAYAAGNGYWEQQQLAAWQTYQGQAASAAAAFAGALPSVTAYAAAAVAGTPVAASDIASYQAQFTAGTLPPALATQAATLGLDTATQQSAAAAIAAADATQTAALIGSGYSEPTAVPSFQTLANALQPGSAPCFAAGTRIATPRGEIRVEDLRPGDPVLTVGGAARHVRPVRWVGHLTIDLARHAWPARAAPIRIRAHAFADGAPARDLLVSPDHALLCDGMLVHAGALVNGRSIVREFPRRIIYWHVELERHAVLLAENLPAESYLDLGNRGWFDGEPGARPLHPDVAARIWDARACAPLLLDGPRLHALRARLLARAAPPSRHRRAIASTPA